MRRTAAEVVVRQHMRRSLFKPDGTLRLALDAALSSPSGLGVAVDADGKVIGGVQADDVIEALANAAEALTRCTICSPISTTPGR